MKELHKQGTAKKQALNQILDRCRAIAAERNEPISPEIEKAVGERASDNMGRQSKRREVRLRRSQYRIQEKGWRIRFRQPFVV
jgi:hypothetical protein